MRRGSKIKLHKECQKWDKAFNTEAITGELYEAINRFTGHKFKIGRGRN